MVEVLDVDPARRSSSLRARSTIPLVWMPWQRQVLDPYLLPPELPETELAELAEYAMSFVKRNDYDLLDTLLDINQTIFREYAYTQGVDDGVDDARSTSTSTAAACARTSRTCSSASRACSACRRATAAATSTRGRKISIPANQRQGEASHAWVQLYLPEVGWKGFDPTNGILTQTDHVRVAVGRNYVDATPTSGTIFVGGGGETLSVEVTVEPHSG